MTDPKKPKIGAEHASAMLRQGLRELRQAVYPESTIATQTEQGIWGTKTPGEVAQDRRGEASRFEDESTGNDSIVNQRLEQAESRANNSERNKEMER